MDSTEYAAAVARKIKKAIDARGLTIEAFANLTMIPRATLNRRLNTNGNSPFSLRELKDVARALNTTAAELALVYEHERIPA